MSRGNVGGKSVARMDAFTWLSNVKVGGRRESSSGAASGADSAGNSRMNSRAPSGLDLSSQVQEAMGPYGRDQMRGRIQTQNQDQSQDGSRKPPSPSRSRTSDDKKEVEGQPLQDE